MRIVSNLLGLQKPLVSFVGHARPAATEKVAADTSVMEDLICFSCRANSCILLVAFALQGGWLHDGHAGLERGQDRHALPRSTLRANACGYRGGAYAEVLLGLSTG